MKLLKPFHINRIIVFLMLVAISNVEAKDSTDVMKYTGLINVSGQGLGGQFTQFIFSTGLNFSVTGKRWEFNNSSSYRYNQTLGNLIEDNWHQINRFSYYSKWFEKKLFPIIYYNYENNLIFRVLSRHYVALGLSTIQEWNKQKVQLSMGYSYDYAEFNGINFENTDRLGPIRRRNYFIVALEQNHNFLKGKINLTNIFTYRHSIEESSDYVIFIHPMLRFKVLKNLSLHGSYQLRLENVHLTALSDINTIFLYGLTFKFAN